MGGPETMEMTAARSSRWRPGCTAFALLTAACACAAGARDGKSDLHIARARPVGFTMYLNDGAGYRWDI